MTKPVARKGLTKMRVVVAAIAAVVTVAPVVSPAATAQAPALIVGTGTGVIAPGLTAEPHFQSIHFTLDLMLGVGYVPPISTGCWFSGQSTSGETVLAGTGWGTLGSCAGARVEGILLYNRSLDVLSFGGYLSIEGDEHGVSDPSTCQWKWTSANPTTSYMINCHFTLT